MAKMFLSQFVTLDAAYAKLNLKGLSLESIVDLNILKASQESETSRK